MVLIKAENITKEYDGVKVINGVTLTVSEGEFLSVVGASGSGKSTLVNMLATFLPVTSGKIIVDGIDITNCSSAELTNLRRNVIGFCYQDKNLIPELNVHQNIILPLQFSRTKHDADMYAYLIETLQLSTFLKKLPTQLSGGEAQRAAIARSLLKKPKVVFLDEPIGNLDSKNGENVIALLHKLNAELNTAFIQVTHNIQSTQNTKIIEIKDGTIYTNLQE